MSATRRPARGGRGPRRPRSRPARSESAAEPLHPTETPPDIDSFDDWELEPRVAEAIAAMGITKPTPIQALAIGPVLE